MSKRKIISYNSSWIKQCNQIIDNVYDGKRIHLNDNRTYSKIRMANIFMSVVLHFRISVKKKNQTAHSTIGYHFLYSDSLFLSIPDGYNHIAFCWCNTQVCILIIKCFLGFLFSTQCLPLWLGLSFTYLHQHMLDEKRLCCWYVPIIDIFTLQCVCNSDGCLQVFVLLSF